LHRIISEIFCHNKICLLGPIVKSMYILAQRKLVLYKC